MNAHFLHTNFCMLLVSWLVFNWDCQSSCYVMPVHAQIVNKVIRVLLNTNFVWECIGMGFACVIFFNMAF